MEVSIFFLFIRLATRAVDLPLYHNNL